MHQYVSDFLCALVKLSKRPPSSDNTTYLSVAMASCAKHAFDTLLLSPPLAFSAAVGQANLLSAANRDDLTALIDKVIEVYFSNASISTSSKDDNMGGNGGYKENVMKALLFIIRSRENAAQIPTREEFLASISDNTILSTEAAELLIDRLDAFKAANGSAIKSAFKSSGTLVNLRWKLGVAITSSAEKGLQAPFVSLFFDVRSVDGELSSHSMELSYQKFLDVHKSFSDVSVIMKNL